MDGFKDHRLPLPEGIQPLSVQVAGHIFGKSKTKLGFLQTENGTVLKPVIPKKGENELNFYKYVTECSQKGDVVMEKLQKIIPLYYGNWVTPLHPGVTYLKLEDLKIGMRYPCVGDIKIGLRSYHHSDSPDKIQREIAKFPIQHNIGFRFLGIKVFNMRTEEYEEIGKKELSKLTAEEVISKGIKKFVNQRENSREQLLLVKAILQKLKAMEEWFMLQTHFHFIASSVLIIYEGSSWHLDRDNSGTSCHCRDDNVCTLEPSLNCATSKSCLSVHEQPYSSGMEFNGICDTCLVDNYNDALNDLIKVKLIDFTYAREESTTDDNNLAGIRKLILCFENIL